MKFSNSILLIILLTSITNQAVGQWSNSSNNYTSGNLGIGTQSPSEKLDVNGAIK